MGEHLVTGLRSQLVCTTEGPLDSLEHHKKIRDDGFEIKVHTAFRPDPAMAVENPASWNAFVDKLGEVCDSSIAEYSSFIEALHKDIHRFFRPLDHTAIQGRQVSRCQFERGRNLD